MDKEDFVCRYVLSCLNETDDAYAGVNLDATEKVICEALAVYRQIDDLCVRELSRDVLDRIDAVKNSF